MDVYNINHDIEIRILDKSDLYNGMFVQSCGNSDHIYEIRIKGNTIQYKTTYLIEGRDIMLYESENLGKEKYDGGYFNVVGIDAVFIDASNDIHWCETIYSRRYNLKEVREEKLKKLGI